MDGIWKLIAGLALLVAVACLVVMFAMVKPQVNRNEARLRRVYTWIAEAQPSLARTHAKVWAGDGDPPPPPPPPPDWD